MNYLAVKGATKTVFSRPFYIFLALLSSFALLMIMLWLPNFKLIGIYLQSNVPFFDKISFLLGFLGAFGTRFTLFSAFYTFAIAIVFGINISMMVYYISRAKIKVAEGSGVIGQMVGLIIGIVGVGCASCGALLLTPLIGTAAAGVVTAFLPFHGVEFAILGIVILLWSTYLLSKKIHNPYI